MCVEAGKVVYWVKIWALTLDSLSSIPWTQIEEEEKQLGLSSNLQMNAIVGMHSHFHICRIRNVKQKLPKKLCCRHLAQAAMTYRIEISIVLFNYVLTLDSYVLQISVQLSIYKTEWERIGLQEIHQGQEVYGQQSVRGDERK